MDYLSERAKQLHQGAIRAMFDKSAGMDDIINMGIGEPDLNTPAKICEAAAQALKEGKTHYTPNAGTLECRQAVAAHSSIKTLQYDPVSEIIITPGGMGALSLFLSVVVNEGDEVLVQDPQWLNYVSQIQFFGGAPVPVPVRSKECFVLKAAEIEKRITTKTKLLMLNSPNNPTGCVIPPAELMAIADIAKKYDLLVVSDEVYNTICYEDAFLSISMLPDMKERTVVINSLSKAFAMTGWRLGYAAGPADIIKKMTQAQENISACANSAAQAAAVYALKHPDFAETIRDEFVRRRKIILAALDAIPEISYCVPQGAFYVFPDISTYGMTSYEFCSRLLEEERVVCIPGSAFGVCGEGHIRMAYTCSEDELTEAMRRFSRFCESVRRG